MRFMVGITWQQMQIENILGLEGQVQNSGEGHTHVNTHLCIQKKWPYDLSDPHIVVVIVFQ